MDTQTITGITTGSVGGDVYKEVTIAITVGEITESIYNTGAAVINFLQNIEIDLLQLVINCFLLFFVAIGDVIKRKIYNCVIHFCFAVNFIYLILFHRELVLTCLIQSLVCVTILFLLYLKCKQIGAGDIKLFSLVFFCYPFFISAVVCLISIILSIFMLIVIQKKQLYIPLAPFVFIGNLIVTIFVTIY